MLNQQWLLEWQAEREKADEEWRSREAERDNQWRATEYEWTRKSLWLAVIAVVISSGSILAATIIQRDAQRAIQPTIIIQYQTPAFGQSP